MLPDYPKTKNYLQKEFSAAIEKQIRKNPLLSMIQFRESHEGDSFELTSEDGFSQRGTYKEVFEKFEISNDELVIKGPEAYFSRVEQIAQKMIYQHSQDLLKKIEEATERTGNIVEAKSKPLSPELILAALDKVAISFDEFGNPIFPALIVSPEQFEKIKEEIPKWESDPALKLKHKALIEKKRQEWFDRESSRKLVD